MKKLFAMLVIISVLVGMFSVAAFAAGATEYDNWFEFWGAARDGETEGEVDGFFGNWHVFKHENGRWYGHYRFLEIGYRGWCPICNDNPTEEPPAGGEIESGTTPDEPTSSEPVESDPTSSEPTSSEPVESEPTSSEPTSSEPVESEPTSSEPTSSEPVESEPTSSEPVESEPTSSEPTSSEPVESEPTSSEPTSSEPVESESAPATTDKGDDDKDSDKDNDNDVPNTGDNSMTALWMTVLGVSAMAFIATLIVGKKKSL